MVGGDFLSQMLLTILPKGDGTYEQLDSYDNINYNKSKLRTKF